jgi:dUTP pyrophosphatase
MKPTVKFKKLSATAVVPAYATAQAAGLDLCSDEDGVTIAPGEHRLVATNLAMMLPAGFEGQVRPRSGLALKSGITVANSPGTIDADYRGPVGVILHNFGQTPFKIARGDRIAQLVIAPVAAAEVVEVAEIDDTARGAGGFGSTGVAAKT